jgi:hypothetical protein
MRRKPGDLPGRYVPPHIRKWPNRPREYVNVAEYQEHVEPPPSPVQPATLQGELDLVIEPEQARRTGFAALSPSYSYSELAQ